MTAPQIVQEIEAAGGVLTLNGDRILYDVPKRARSLVDVLREHHDEVFRVLRERTCYPHGAGTTWWVRSDGSQVRALCHPDPYTLAVKRTNSIEPPDMPEGVRLLDWKPKHPPVAITTCAVVDEHCGNSVGVWSKSA